MAVSAPSAVQAVAAARLALAETLLLKPGQAVQAVVVGKTPAGLTTLKIGDQLVQAQLPQNLPTGTTLQRAVKAGGATPQLVVVSQTLPGQASAAVPQPIAVTPLPLPPEANAVPERPVLIQQPVVEAKAPVANGESVQQVTVQPLRAESGAAVTPSPVAVKDGVAANAPLTRAPVVVVAQTPAPQGPVVQAMATTTPSRAPPIVVAQIAPETAPLVTTATNPTVQPAAMEIVARPVPVAAAVPLPAAVEAAVVMAQPGQPVVPPALPQAASERPQSAAMLPIANSAPVATEAPIPPVARPVPVAASVPIAPEPEAEASSPLLVAQAAARPQATMADLPRAVAPPTVAQAVSAPAPQQPATPQAALAQMVPEALARQDSVGPLLNSLAAVVQKAAVLPEPVLRAALGVLAQRIVVTEGKIAAADIERAVAKSGVFLEATLAKALPQSGDAKSGLLVLREALGKWLGEAPAMPVSRDAAPPPLKGLPLRAPAAPLPPLPEGPRDVARALHGQTDAAVSRTKLMQMASLPDTDMARPANTPLRMELPFLIGHELVMAQIQIAREGSRREAERKRGWTMRFALNFSATGEVGAEVGLLGKAVNVALWAVEPETAEAMQAALPELAAALEAIGLDPGAVRIRQGAPEPERPVSGRLLDSVS
jgi:hypothetical protein